jgi:tetrahydromethanopterin S-methyltransferase subunit F
MTEESRDDRPQAPADLSAAARAIVRDPGDPRIDAHLAALGLGDENAPAIARARQQAGAAAEVAELRRQIGELERELESGRARIRGLAITLIAAAVAILILLAVAVLR